MPTQDTRNAQFEYEAVHHEEFHNSIFIHEADAWNNPPNSSQSAW